VVAGVMTERYGWRSFWWCNTAICIFALTYQIFLLPETKWNRRTDFLESQSGDQEAQPETPNPQSEKDEITEKSFVDAVENTSALHTPPSEEEILVKLSGGPSKQQFLPFQGFDTSEGIMDVLWLPFKLLAFPIVQWSSFVFSWSASCFLVANITQSQAFAGPPWNLGATSVGYTNFAIFVGASIALLTAGPLSDWVSMRATIKNKGIREPEMRLPAIIPFACATLIGSVILAVGYQQGWNWKVIVIIGYTLLGLQVAAVAAIATTYAVSSAPCN
jgi:MFS family permease